MGNQQPLNGQPGDDLRQNPRGHSPYSAGPYIGPGGGGGPTTGGGGYPGPSGGGGGAGRHHHHPGGQGHYSSQSGGGAPSLGGDPAGMQRSSSDASMTMLDNDALQQHVSNSSNPAASGGVVPPNVESFLHDDTVPTVFRWEHGGRQVYITGTFNGWSRQIPMHRSGNDFTYIHNLKRGKHAFKFIVDDEWRFAPDQPTVADIEGRINNFIDVTDFKAYTGDRDFEKEKAAAEYGCSELPLVGGGGAGDHPDVENDADGEVGGKTVSGSGKGGGSTTTSNNNDHNNNKKDRDGEIFSNDMPDVDDYTKEPPPLPPHLRHIILNKPPQLQDTAALPVPQHVALNHLYCTAIKDNMMVLGITQRYKTKFVTTVYYSPCASK